MLFGFWKKKKKEPQIKCSKCGGENPEDADFCMDCGANLQDQKRVQEKVDEATDITEDFKDKGGFWAKWVPGYRGYKRKEIRRESDKILRDHLVTKLKLVKTSLNDLQEEAAEDVPEILAKLEDMRTELDTFTKKIDHADYGMGAMFGAQKIKINELDSLIEFDRGMVEKVMEIEEAIKALADDLSDDPETKVKEIRKMIKAHQKIYEQRDEFITGWTPD
ncbi:MAG: hypothetical protein ACFFCS_11025 [Candidatus Hodarchaeota archaeon]